jgi:predicted metal-dependent hydrolase
MGEAWRRAVASGALDGPHDRCHDPPPPGLVEGVRLFNAGQFYECHEVLEDIWHAEREPIRYLYQGILQIGVGFHHWRNGNFRGAHLLLTDGIDKVRRFTPGCMAVDTDALVEQAAACLEQLFALGPEQMRTFDWSHVPHIAITETGT